MVFPGGSASKEYACGVETWVQYLDGEDALEEGMVTHSSVLAWRISMDREEPGWSQSMGSQRVRRD